MSKGEDLIIQLLNNAQIKFEREKTFHDLKCGAFRYDFYCSNINGCPVIIEFNGLQHYKQVKQFQPTRADFQKAQEHDRRKISYALANNIKIYCIPFWDINKLHNAMDLFNEKYLAKTRWHNDEMGRLQGYM